MDLHKLTFEVVTDPVEDARRLAHDEQWLEAHWSEIVPQAYEKCVAVPGQKAFIADTGEEAEARARAAHPDDEGLLSQYVFPPGGPRIYGNRGKMGLLR